MPVENTNDVRQINLCVFCENLPIERNYLGLVRSGNENLQTAVLFSDVFIL